MSEQKIRVAVLVSGGGTNLQALIDAVSDGKLKNTELSIVVSSNPNAYALERAAAAGVKSAVLRPKDFETRGLYCDALSALLKSEDIGLIVLAGFKFILPSLAREYENRMINTHPALIPSFCGDGFFGLKVHQAVLDYGVKVTGATVHFADEVTDGGPIILQKSTYVCDGDTPETLQQRVMRECEWEILVEAVRLFCDGRLKVEGRKVRICV